MHTFSEDPTLFLHTINMAINDDNDLSNIEQFMYLKVYVSGEAARCIEGLAQNVEIIQRPIWK